MVLTALWDTLNGARFPASPRSSLRHVVGSGEPADNVELFKSSGPFMDRSKTVGPLVFGGAKRAP